MSNQDVKLTGIAAATSHLHDLHLSTGGTEYQQWDNEMSLELMNMLSPAASPIKPSAGRRITMILPDDVDLENHILQDESVDQFKLTFNSVKADLAARKPTSAWSLSDEWLSSPSSAPVAFTPTSMSLSSSIHRTSSIRKAVEELDMRLVSAQASLNLDLLRASNIRILTPFQGSTRTRLLAALQTISKRATQMRLEVAKLSCYRDVLLVDLTAETREQEQAKLLALQAATETLQSQQVSNYTVDLEPSAAPLHKRESTSESFHSALDFAIDWPYNDMPYSEPSPLPNTAFISTDSLHSIPFSSSPHALSFTQPPSSRTSADSQAHQKFYTAQEDLDDEEAEAWDATRCAKRVSLVRVPSSYTVLGLAAKRDRMPVNLDS
jgi:hypothetical protein